MSVNVISPSGPSKIIILYCFLDLDVEIKLDLLPNSSKVKSFVSFVFD